MISSDFSPEYPASAQRCCLVCPRGFLIRFFRTSSTCVTSCRLAPVTTIDNGTPRSSTRICRLVPFFPPISRIWPYWFLCSRGFYHCSVDTLPCPCNSFHFIIFSKSFLPEFTEKSEWFPFSEITMHTAGTAIFFRQGFLLNACTQNIWLPQKSCGIPSVCDHLRVAADNFFSDHVSLSVSREQPAPKIHPTLPMIWLPYSPPALQNANIA